MTPNPDFTLLKGIRWTARIWASLSAAFILLTLLGHAVPDGLKPLLALTTRETLMMIAFLSFWSGLVLGWFWELLGGFLVLASMAAFYILDYSFSGTFPRGPYFALLAVPGVLYLIAGLGNQRTTGNSQPSG